MRLCTKPNNLHITTSNVQKSISIIPVSSRKNTCKDRKSFLQAQLADAGTELGDIRDTQLQLS
jgi:hypothetical protein